MTQHWPGWRFGKTPVRECIHGTGGCYYPIHNLHCPAVTGGEGGNKDDEELDIIIREATIGTGEQRHIDIENAILAVHDFGCVECHNSDMQPRCPIRLRISSSLERIAG